MAKNLQDVVQYLFQIAAQAEFNALNDCELLKRHVELNDNLAFGELVRRYRIYDLGVFCSNVSRHHRDGLGCISGNCYDSAPKGQDHSRPRDNRELAAQTAFKVASNAKVLLARRHAREEGGPAKMRQES